MTQKQKATAYDEAIERAKKLQETCDSQAVVGWCEYIFPELAESEDEKIRKWIIDDIRYNMDNETLENSEYKKQAEKAIAWLEKQGNLMKALQISNARIGELIEENYYLKEQLEKQGVNSVSVTKGNTSVTNAEVVSHPTVSTIIEPKFKDGDWIVQNGLGTYKIVEVCESWYEVISYNDGIQYSIGFDKENDCHLWTIQDAKDGDVLAAKDKDKIFIYNGKLDLRGRVCAYCGIYKTCDGLRFTKCAIGNYFTYKEPHPATKEQRDLLFTKMKEAGYEWDAEKKELKKIEDVEYDGEDYGIDSLWHAKNILEKTLGNVDGYQSDDGILEHKCAITAIKKLYEQKTTEWNKKDEENFEGVMEALNFCNHEGVNPYDIDPLYLVSWLKSFKDRVHPKREWSERDKDYYDAIIAKLEVTQEDAALTYNQMNFLKSLKDRIVPQSQQEWDEEDEKMVIALMSICDEWATRHSYLPVENNDIEKIKSWLKSLRPQNTCKPSYEHYELEEFAKIVRSNLTGISKVVQELFETKYLQLTGNKMYEGFKD